jgi:hypothetical protein
MDLVIRDGAPDLEGGAHQGPKPPLPGQPRD